MRFALHAEVDDNGRIVYKVDVPDGQTVFRKEVANALVIFLGWATSIPDARVLTRAEVSAFDAERKLPAGWEATLDGVCVEVDASHGSPTFSRHYRRELDGATTSAPCDESGTPTPTTRSVLLAYDYENPPPQSSPDGRAIQES